jgi:acetyl esterase/lipase
MEENIIVIGRSIGTGVALELLKKGKDSKTRQPRSLVLISPFSNVKELAK